MDDTCVIIAGMYPQPIQTWVLIRKVAKEYHNALILPRSANKFNERNPIPIGLRKTPVGDAEGT